MKSSPLIFLLRTAALLCLLSALGLALYEYRQFQARPGVSAFPSGAEIAGVPVGGLSREEAAARIQAAYAVPVELGYQDAVFQARPAELGFSLDLDQMISQASLPSGDQKTWSAFWDDLWSRAKPAVGQKIPLLARVDEAALRQYLTAQVAARYDQAPRGTRPNSDAITFSPVASGTGLDVEAAVPLVRAALLSRTERSVQLPVRIQPPPHPSLAVLAGLLRQIVEYENYSGLVEVYIQDLRSGKEINFALQNGRPVEPGIAFTAASTIKIPVMVSVFRSAAEPTSPQVEGLVENMITESDNPSTDRVAQEVLDPQTAPLKVTADARALGFKNIFWAGFFAPGAPLLDIYHTPANQRTDVDTSPDIYAQATPAEMGRLLAEIYTCAQKGAGALVETFPGQISQAECQHMLELLRGNHTPMLLAAGLPDGVRFGHKHGWVVETSDGLIHTMADAGVVFSPHGDYVIDIYLYSPNQLVFDPINTMVAYLSTAVYNYFNIPAQ